MSNDPHMIQAAEQYLSSLGITLWADWDISKPEGVKKAAEWLAREVENTLDTYDEIMSLLYHDEYKYVWPFEPEGESE